MPEILAGAGQLNDHTHMAVNCILPLSAQFEKVEEVEEVEKVEKVRPGFIALCF